MVSTKTKFNDTSLFYNNIIDGDCDAYPEAHPLLSPNPPSPPLSPSPSHPPHQAQPSLQAHPPHQAHSPPSPSSPPTFIISDPEEPWTTTLNPHKYTISSPLHHLEPLSPYQTHPWIYSGCFLQRNWWKITPTIMLWRLWVWRTWKKITCEEIEAFIGFNFAEPKAVHSGLLEERSSLPLLSHSRQN